jgi:hypothetical protein
VHNPGLDRVYVGCEVVNEVVLGEPGEALLVDVEVGELWARRPLIQQRADRFPFVESERGDVDEADDVRAGLGR